MIQQKIIAEVKTTSPFGFRSDKTWEHLFAIAQQAGDIISIHTDSRWGGSFALLKKARAMTRKPILAKGIHANDDDICKAIASGADYVLVVGRIPAIYTEKCFIEPLSLDELRKIPKNYNVVWNTRELATGKHKKETFAQARAIRGGWLCQASNITSIHDIEAGANAVLVGTHLERFITSLQ